MPDRILSSLDPTEDWEEFQKGQSSMVRVMFYVNNVDGRLKAVEIWKKDQEGKQWDVVKSLLPWLVNLAMMGAMYLVMKGT
jgi:hypothetical protein